MTVQLKELDQLQDAMGERLRRFRRDRDMTLAVLADKTGLSVSYLSDLERGRTMPSIKTLVKIAGAYNARLMVDFAFEGWSDQP